MGAGNEEIVRCGECALAVKLDREDDRSWCELNSRYVSENEFCAWAEPMMKQHCIQEAGILRLKVVSMRDIPPRRTGDVRKDRQRKFDVYSGIVDEFMGLGCDACEIRGLEGKDSHDINRIACAMRGYVKSNDIPVTVTQRENRVFFIRECEDE